MRTLLIFTAVVGSFVAADNELPSFFPVCGRKGDKTKLDNCMLEATEKIRPYIVKGIKKLGFTPLNPLKVTQVSLEQGGSASSFKASVKDMVIYGLDQYKFKKLDFDFDKHTCEAIADIPKIYAEGVYLINGKLLSAPIEGKGLFKANISLTTADIHIKSKVEVRGGIEYLHHYEYKLNLKLGKVTSHGIDGLFEDNETLAKATKTTIDENIDELLDSMKPAIEKVITSLFQNVYFKKLDTIPYDVLFPPIEN